MTAKLSLFVVCCFAFPFSIFAQQMDATALRAKYGEPLARETFQVRPNIEAIVTYGSGRQVCRIELPPGRNIAGEIPPGVATTQQVDEVVEELAPLSMRGKKMGRGIIFSGRISFASDNYENVNIAEPQDNGHRTAVTITFNRPDCH